MTALTVFVVDDGSGSRSLKSPRTAGSRCWAAPQIPRCSRRSEVPPCEEATCLVASGHSFKQFVTTDSAAVVELVVTCDLGEKVF